MIDGPELTAGLRRYIDGDAPIYPTEDRRFVALHEVLYRLKPDPALLAPLFGPHPDRDEVDDALQKWDKISLAVVTSFLRRIVEDPDDPKRAALYDAVAAAAVPWAFERAWGDSHTLTGEEVGDFFSEAEWPACPEATAAVARHLEALIERWRRRVSDKASSMFFGIVLRHVGAAGAGRLFREWERMHEDERVDLLKRSIGVEGLGEEGRRCAVGALLDESQEVREAAVEALEARGAPLQGLDASSRDEAIRAALPRLERWAAETES